MGTVVMHNVVVSHRPRPQGWHPEAPFHFVDGVAEAVTKARELAGDRNVGVAAGDVGGQAFALGLIGELAMDVLEPGSRAGPRRGCAAWRPRCGGDPAGGNVGRSGRRPATSVSPAGSLTR